MDRSLPRGESCAFYLLIHVSLCTQPCAEQSWGPKSDMVSVLTEFLIWKEDKYELLECKVIDRCFGQGSEGQCQSQSPKGAKPQGRPHREEQCLI